MIYGYDFLQELVSFQSKEFVLDTITTASSDETTSFHYFGLSSSKRVEYEEPFNNMGHMGAIR